MSGISKAKPAVVVTSIAAPGQVLKKIAVDCTARGMNFIVIGDTKSPADFSLEGCSFFSVENQLKLALKTPELCPTRHYARKNIGYLLAIQAGAPLIFETDDDNLPGDEFYKALDKELEVPTLSDTGWVNIYKYYSSHLIWPRGLPLDAVNTPLPELNPPKKVIAPIQQGLADDNPDVDAIYRLTLPLPIIFEGGLKRIALESNAWCPFNSQNTVFYPEAFPLLYLPAYCSFRMTDIWRSFVAQRIAWVNNWTILFRESTVVQFRNDHSLMKDFEDEIPGYLNNRKIGETLKALILKPGVEAIPDNMRVCYEALVKLGVIGAEELPLLNAWLEDLDSIRVGS